MDVFWIIAGIAAVAVLGFILVSRHKKYEYSRRQHEGFVFGVDDGKEQNSLKSKS